MLIGPKEVYHPNKINAEGIFIYPSRFNMQGKWLIVNV